MKTQYQKNTSGIYVATLFLRDGKTRWIRDSHIWRLNGRSPELVATRPGEVSALATFNGEVYDAVGNVYGEPGKAKIFRTLKDPEGKNPVAERKYEVKKLFRNVSSLTDYCGREFVSPSMGKHFRTEQYFDTLWDPEGKEPLLDSDNAKNASGLLLGGVLSGVGQSMPPLPEGLVGYDDEIYFCIDGKIAKRADFESPAKLVAERKGAKGLYLYKGRLLDLSILETKRDNDGARTYVSRICDTFDDPEGRKPLAEIPGYVVGLCNDGKLYDLREGGKVYETLEGKLVHDFKEIPAAISQRGL